MSDESQDQAAPPSATVQIYDIIFNIVGLQTIGIAGTVSNVFILVVLRRSKSLQTPCFLLIAGECICSIFLAAGLSMGGVEEAVRLTHEISLNRTRIYCHLMRTFFPAWGIQAGSMVIALISLDRLISVLSPLRYRNLGKRYAYAGLGFCYTYVTIASIGSLVDNNPEGFGPLDVIPCRMFFSPFTPGYFSYYGWFNLAFSASCILLYASMLITFEWRRRMHNTAPDHSHAAFMRQQMACMPMIKLLMAIYMVTGVLPEITVAAAASSALCRPYMPRMHYYGSVLKSSMSLAEIVALGFGSREFRACTKKLLGRKAPSVLELQPMPLCGTKPATPANLKS